MKLRAISNYTNRIWCWLFRCEIRNPGNWEFGWWSERENRPVHFSLCECKRCGRVVDSHADDWYIWDREIWKSYQDQRTSSSD